MGTTTRMDFRDAARLDTSRVSDVRGRGGFGGGRGRGAAIGGGGLGIVGLLVALLLGVDPSQLGGGGADSLGAGGAYGGSGLASTQDLAAQCQTGADADRDETCRFVALENSLSDYWTTTVQGLQPPSTQLFDQGVNTGCGQASSAVGPFYCPADQGIYLDPGFFAELQSRYGAQGGDFAQAYVLAHEYGHHVQHVTGASEQAQQLSSEGEQSGSVRLELQADCYAGVWAANAQSTGFLSFDDTDVVEGLSAAAAVGDDRIQERSAGRVDPESWTHGSAEQRQRWFRTGLSSGDPRDCDTFGVPEV
jgi:predicted metalloprotease